METAMKHEIKEMPAGPKETEERRKTPVIYALDTADTDEIIRLCALLQARGCCGESDLYTADGRDGGSSYYLVIRENGSRSGEGIPPCAILNEYGTRVASAAMLLCLREHAAPVCLHDAVERMAELVL